MSRAGADNMLNHSITGKSGVAIDQALAGGRGDHEWRIGDDQVEGFIHHRLEIAAIAHIDIDLIELSVETCQPQGTGIDVGRDDMLGMGGQMQRLHPTAGAQIECGAHLVADGHLGQGCRG